MRTDHKNFHPKLSQELEESSEPYEESSEDEISESECGETIIELKYKGQNIYASEIGMDSGWTDLNQDTVSTIKAICSYGFASCLATIIKSSDNSYISLRHDSVSKGEEGVIDRFIKTKREEISKKTDVIIGFSWTSYREGLNDELKNSDFTKEQFEESIKDQEALLKYLETKYNTKTIMLPKSTILIDRDGVICTSISQEEMEPEYIVEVDTKKSPSTSPASAESAQVNYTKENKGKQ